MALGEQLDAYDGPLRTLQAFETQVNGLCAEAKQLLDAETHRRAATSDVSGRVAVEMREAESRLSRQSDTLASCQRKLEKLTEAAATEEEEMEAELLTCSRELAAAELRESLARQSLTLMTDHQARLMEATCDVRPLQMRMDRVSSTEKELSDLRDRILDSERSIAAGKRHEGDAVEAEELAHAAAHARFRAYDIDRHCFRALATLQDMALSLDFPEPSAGESQPIGPELTTRLVGEARELLLSQQNECAQEVHTRAECETTDREQTENAHEDRQATLREVRAERKAVEVAFAQRTQLLDDTQAQLSVEKQQVHLAEVELSDQRHCVHVLQTDVEIAKFRYGTSCSKPSSLNL